MSTVPPPDPAQDPALQAALSDVAGAVPVVVHDVETKNVTGLINEAVQLGSEATTLAPTVIREIKAGYKTTEFYAGIAAALNATLTHEGWAPKAVVAGLAAIYALARALAKYGYLR